MVDVYVPRSGVLKRLGRPDIGGGVSADPPGWTGVFEDDFGSLNTSRWSIRTDNTFGHAAPQNRIQDYNTENVTIDTNLAGATGNTGLVLRNLRVGSAPGASYTAGWVETSTGFHLPRYYRLEARMRIPHGHGLWPALWTVHTNGGADEHEIDIMEYFHSQVPGRLTVTLHGRNNAGTVRYNYAKMNPHAAFELPTPTPGWHTVVLEVSPENGVPDAPTSSVRYRWYLNGVKGWDYLDNEALHWSSLGTATQSHKIYCQTQIGGQYVGHPEDPLGYSRWLNGSGGCLIGGTPPNSCTITSSGNTIRAADWGDDTATAFAVDYIKAWRYTG